MRGKITKTSVDKLKPVVRDDGKLTPDRLWDTEVTGFGCLVTKAGSKSFIFQYRR